MNSEIMIQQSASLPRSNPRARHYVLLYSHTRTASAHVAAEAAADVNFKDFSSIMLGALLVTLVLAWLAGLLHPLICIALFALIAVPFAIFLNCEPTHVETCEKGIRLHYLHKGPSLTTQWIPWNAVLSVGYGYRNEKGVSPKQCFDLTIDTSYMNPAERGWFELLSPLLTAKVERNLVTLRLMEEGFRHEVDRDAFRSALRHFIPNDKIDSNLIAMDELGDVPTYTSLWFESLNQNQVEYLQPLPGGTKLAEEKYEILSTIGAGGQSVVYDGLCGEEKCALKQFVLPVRGGREIRRRAVANIQREARLLQALHHPQIVRYVDLFLEGSRAFLVMERVEGTSLQTLVEKKGPLSVQQTIDLAKQMCDILKYLHGQEPPVVHRDFTPDNLMLSSGGKLKLIDFNVAQRLESNATKTVVGKHAYLPPEQFRGKPTPQSDIYAFGATLQYILTAKDPEPLEQSDPSVLRPETDTFLCEIVKTATAPAEESRYANIDLIISDLPPT